MPTSPVAELIDDLANDLAPVRRQRQSRGMALALGIWAASAAVLIVMLGLREGFAADALPPMALLQMFWATGLAAVALWFAVSMAMPGVGRDHGGWRWAAAVALAVPLAALVSLASAPHAAWEASHPQTGIDCLWRGLVAGLGVGGVLTLWLRQGAPTSPERAGLVVGLASGAAGAAAVALHCPLDGLMHFGLWHAASIAVSAIVGRAILPAVLRW